MHHATPFATMVRLLLDLSPLAAEMEESCCPCLLMAEFWPSISLLVLRPCFQSGAPFFRSRFVETTTNGNNINH